MNGYYSCYWSSWRGESPGDHYIQQLQLLRSRRESMNPKTFIRAKRVSNCYIQEKKTDRLRVCVDVRICFGFSVEKIVLVLV